MAELVKVLILYGNELSALFLTLFCLFRWKVAPADRQRTELLMVVAALSVPLERIAFVTVSAAAHLRTVRYDLYVYRLDEMFGGPSFVLGQTLIGHSAILSTLELSYNMIALAMVGVFAVYLWLRPPREVRMVICTFALNLIAAVPIYLVLPVCGPLYVFPTFPFPPQNVLVHPITLSGLPNGIPSVHLSTALLVLWFLRRWSIGRIFGAIFFGLTVYATLGSGQHYLIDLLCAFPYAAAVYWVAGRVSALTPVTDTYEATPGLECPADSPATAVAEIA